LSELSIPSQRLCMGLATLLHYQLLRKISAKNSYFHTNKITPGGS